MEEYLKMVDDMSDSAPLSMLLYVLAFQKQCPGWSPTSKGNSTTCFVTHACCDNPNCQNVRHMAWGGRGTNTMESIVQHRGVRTDPNYFWCLMELDGFENMDGFPRDVYKDL